MEKLTHFNEEGRARMVDVSAKAETGRRAVARGEVRMRPETLALIRAGGLAKGDVLAVAQVAAVMGAKKTAGLIPMCHPLFLSGINVSFALNEAESKVEIEAEVKNHGQTGVEMEALTAVSVAALTIYDMCKAAEKTMEITGIVLVSKSGGKSGDYRRED
ncbi:MAG: cyclic pyranopterin monophosphate synthase MoaC [Gracilibacteraceae bacterium]|jgi:cyclic pyranopterin phosphate synthase|nr:cyclic pyranopterin monophosphate synthase MoaC [Gracilibacteraceae bacterium]